MKIAIIIMVELLIPARYMRFRFNWCITMGYCTSLFEKRCPFSGTLSQLSETNFQVETINEIPNGIMWNKQQMCSMPSTGQPWTLQRAKWNRSVREDIIEENKDDDSTENVRTSSNGNAIAWMTAMDANDMKTIFNEEYFPICSERSTALSIGAACLSTRVARALTRIYDSNGMLEGVSLQEGILK